MNYFLDLFSPETYEAFKHSPQDVSGFRPRQRNAADRIAIGDRLICYVTKLGRWFGVLEVLSKPFVDSTPIFYPEADPFVVRFQVRPLVLLDLERAVPIYDDSIWRTLSFTKNYEKGSSTWTGKIRASLVQLDEPDGVFLENMLMRQGDGGTVYPINREEYQKLITHVIRRADKDIPVSVPTDSESERHLSPAGPETRESIQIQSLLADIGRKMGLHVWIPKSDRGGVRSQAPEIDKALLDRLPLNYDDVTLRTIEQIDVLWLRGRSIVRAFEIEHTTSIYSGLLRMADLLALQPNMDIRLHIVAPIYKREKVFAEIRRPVFSLLEHGALSESCTYLSYESIEELAQQKHVGYYSDRVLDEYAEEAE